MKLFNHVTDPWNYCTKTLLLFLFCVQILLTTYHKYISSCLELLPHAHFQINWLTVSQVGESVASQYVVVQVAESECVASGLSPL